MRSTVIVVLLCVAVMPDGTVGREDALTPMSLKDIILKKEQDFRTLHVEGRYRTEVWDKQKKEFVFSNGAQVEGWLLNEREGPYRLNVASELLQWADGPEPYAHEKYERAFNGRLTQTLTQRTGNVKEDMLFGELTSTRAPLDTTGSCATGWSMSIYGLYASANKALSDLFDIPNSRCTVHSGSFEGRSSITLTSDRGTHEEGRTISQVVHLDPEKGYALIGYEYLVDGKPLKRIVVDRLIEAAPGIFYPSQARRIHYDANETISCIVYYEAKTAVANSPTFSDDIFTITWPVGVTVLDHVADIQFVTGPDIDESVLLISQQVDQVENLRSETARGASAHTLTDANTSISQTHSDSPDAAVRDHGNEGDAPLPYGTRAPRTHSFRVVLLVGAIVCTCIGTGIWGARRKKSVKHIAVLLVSCMPVTAHSNTYSVGIQELKNATVWNCGLLSTMYILQKNRVHYSAESLATALNVGPKWENPTSLLHIKNVLIDNGFSVAAYKGATGADIIQQLSDTNLCLVNVNKGGVGHFLIVERLNQTEVICVDPGVHVGTFSNAEFAERIDSVATGFCLVVDRDHDVRYHSLKQDRINVTIGEVGLGQGELQVTVPIINDTEHDFRILRMKGQCSCFRGYTVEKSKSDVISEGATDHVVFTLSRTTLRPGAFETQVLCVGANPKERHVVFVIKAKVLPDVKEKITFHPEKVRLAPGTSHKTRVVLFLPHNISLLGYKASTEGVAVRTTNVIDNVNDSGRTLVELEVSLVDIDALRDGSQHIEINITDPFMPTIQIPCIISAGHIIQDDGMALDTNGP